MEAGPLDHTLGKIRDKEIRDLRERVKDLEEIESYWRSKWEAIKDRYSDTELQDLADNDNLPKKIRDWAAEELDERSK